MTSVQEKCREFAIIRPVVIENEGEVYRVVLKVDGQEFHVTPLAMDREAAEFVQHMLCLALERIAVRLMVVPILGAAMMD